MAPAQVLGWRALLTLSPRYPFHWADQAFQTGWVAFKSVNGRSYAQVTCAGARRFALFAEASRARAFRGLVFAVVRGGGKWRATTLQGAPARDCDHGLHGAGI